MLIVTPFLFQDTVVALQAVSYYAAFGGANAINLMFNVSAPASSFVSPFNVNATNYWMYQSQEVIISLIYSSHFAFCFSCCTFVNLAFELLHHLFKVNADKGIHLNIFMEGQGFALFQVQFSCLLQCHLLCVVHVDGKCNTTSLNSP